MRLAIILFTLLAQRTTVHADGAANEVSAGTTLATANGPGSSWIADRIGGIWEVDDKLQLRLDLSLTRSYSADDAPTNSTSTSLSVAYSPNDHWSLSLVGGWTPASTSYTKTTLVTDELTEVEEADETDEMARADALLGSTSTSASVALSVGYDTAGDSDHETSASFGVGATHFQSQQAFSSIVGANGETLTTEYVRELCATQSCSPEIVAALSPLWTQLTQFSIDAGVMRTEYRTTDFGLDASYYLYDKDPTTTGYYRLPGVGPSHLGNGIGVAPLRYSISPSVANRWGKLAGTLNLAYGSYVQAGGYDLSATVRAQYKLALSKTTRLKLHARFGTSWGVDGDNTLTTSLSFSFGGQYSW